MDDHQNLPLPSDATAVVLLLSSPSRLNRAWTKSNDGEMSAKVELELQELPLSTEANEYARKLMFEKLADKRDVFGKVADLMRDFLYSGGEPHPDRDRATMIIKKLQELPPIPVTPISPEPV